MSSEEKEKNIDTFSLYNMAISQIKMVGSEYKEDSKEICELAVLKILSAIYDVKDVYERVLSYMQENDLYERFLKVILELQFNSPQSQSGEGDGEEGEEGNGENSDKESSSKEGKTSQSGGVKTKADKFKGLSKEFIDSIFRIDDTDM